MKKLLAAIAMGALIATSSFALTFKGSAGFAYGLGNYYDDSVNNQKTVYTTNSLGLKLEGDLGLTKDFGFMLETSFLFPLNSECIWKTTYSDGRNDKEGKTTYDGGFQFNGLIGPYYTFDINKSFNLNVAAGFDLMILAFNDDVNYSSVLFGNYNATYTTTNIYLGIGTKADAEFLLSKKAGLKIGLTFAYLWGHGTGSTYVNNNNPKVSETTTDDLDNNSALMLIPDVSFVYRF